MSDIVERLRREAECARNNWPEVFSVTPELADDAASEIERLRAQVDELRVVNDGNMQVSEMFRHQRDTAEDEIERLREFRAHMKAVVEAAGFGSITEALVEIERLRSRLAEAVKVLLDVNDAAQIDVLMEGPRLQGWRRSELDRLWPKLRAFLAMEEKP